MLIVFRASAIGNPCPRKLWYEFVKGYEEKKDNQTLLTFAIGSALESVAVQFLQPPYDIWEVKYNAGSQDAEIETVIPLGHDVEIRGHHDCIVKGRSGEWIMVDIKTMNSYAYSGWKKMGTVRKYPQYVDQLTIYGAGEYAKQHGIKKLAVCALNKDKVDFPLPFDVFDWDQARFDAIRERVLNIGMATDAPVPQDEMPTWACGYCGFKGWLCEYKF